MFLASLAYVVVGFLQTRVDAGVQMSVFWQTLPYLILTTAEVLISTTGLEFAFTQAAAEMKSTIMSFWLLTVAIGNLFVPLITGIKAALISGSADHSAAVNPSTFYLYAGLTAAVAVIFAVVSLRYRERQLELTSAS
jgi:POT family proton-dependent oligopeptide transporter